MSNKKNCHLLFIGCGELGTRHLQAASRLANVGYITVCDLNESMLALGQERVAEMDDVNKNISYVWIEDLKQVDGAVDLCVISTRAKERVACLKQVFEITGCRDYLIEKVVAQSVKQYDELLAFADQHQLRIWVNCKTRAYRIHEYIKSRLDNGPILFNAIGGNHGLGTNGIHEADLFVHYDRAEHIYLFGKHIDQELHKSKRGQGLCDLSGSLCGYTDKGSQFTFSFARHHKSPDHISILGAEARFMIDHYRQQFFESYEKDGWEWKPIQGFDENWMVSVMSTDFIYDILTKQSCKLPTLQDCYPAHKFILEALQPAFQNLTSSSESICPIT